jgi:hypothetical protein
MNQSQSNSKGQLQAGQPLNAMEQRIWIKEQEVSALKVQNRHLLSKLEELTQAAKPNQVNTQFIALEVQKSLQPVLQELDKSIKGAFEILQSTMRGVYQQSQRCQQAVEEMGGHTRDIEVRIQEQRKADQVFFQDKILSSVTAFCDRMERQIENRLKSLGVIEVLNNKQNEMLNDLDQVKAMVTTLHKHGDLNRADLGRIEKDAVEVGQKLIEVQVQTQNSEELSRDVLQQVQNHRSEFKLLRGELRAILESTQKLTEKVYSIEDQLVRNHEEKLEREIKNIEAADSIHDLIEVREKDIENVQSVLETSETSQNKEDLALILSMLQAQKNDLKRIAKEAEIKIRASQSAPISAVSAVDLSSNINGQNSSVQNSMSESSNEVQSVQLNDSSQT